MTSWIDKVKEAVANPQLVTRDHPLRKVVDEFVDALNTSPWLSAAIYRNGIHQLDIVIRPKLRRDLRQNLLSLWFEWPSTVRIQEDGPAEILAEPEALQLYLELLVARPEVQATIASWQRMQGTAVQGKLVIGESRTPTMVSVEPAEHRKLAEAVLARHERPLTLRIKLQDDEPLGGKPDSLESGGFRLDVTAAKQEEGRILQVDGVPDLD